METRRKNKTQKQKETSHAIYADMEFRRGGYMVGRRTLEKRVQRPKISGSSKCYGKHLKGT